MSTVLREAGNNSLERASEGAARPQNDAFSAYRIAGPSADASAARPNVVENGELFFPPIFSAASTEGQTPKVATNETAASTEAAGAKGTADATIANAANTSAIDNTSAMATPWVDTRSPEMIAAITDQGALPDPGLAVPMFMRFAPDAMQGVYQQEYGYSALNGFVPGAPIITPETQALPRDEPAAESQALSPENS